MLYKVIKQATNV